MVFGMLLAFGASALFNVAVAVQALDARTLPADHSLRLSLLGELARRPRWRLGVALALVALGALALLPYVYRNRRAAHGLPTVLSAGVAFALSGFITKLVSDDLSAHAWLSAWLWANLVGCAAVTGMLSENTALQTRPAAQVAPLVFSAQTVLPVLLAPLLAGESWSNTPLSGGAVVISLLIVVVGVALLATS